jgi:hypothetical protein
MVLPVKSSSLEERAGAQDAAVERSRTASPGRAGLTGCQQLSRVTGMPRWEEYDRVCQLEARRPTQFPRWTSLIATGDPSKSFSAQLIMPEDRTSGPTPLSRRQTHSSRQIRALSDCQTSRRTVRQLPPAR